MSLELICGMIALFGMAAIGTPVAYAIIFGVLVYLGVAGQDLAIAATTMVQRLFDGFLLLAVPLFQIHTKDPPTSCHNKWLLMRNSKKQCRAKASMEFFFFQLIIGFP